MIQKITKFIITYQDPLCLLAAAASVLTWLVCAVKN